jgi:hypothetical protein
MGFVDGPNVYTYVTQNPWTYFDPLGLDKKGFFQAVESALYAGSQILNNPSQGLEAAYQTVGAGIEAVGWGVDAVFGSGSGDKVGETVQSYHPIAVAEDTVESVQEIQEVMHAGVDPKTAAIVAGGIVLEKLAKKVGLHKKVEELTQSARDIQKKAAKDTLNGGNRIDPSKIAAPPPARGKAPIGADGKPVELHHADQTAGNYKKNHPNTGQSASTVDRVEFDKMREEHWEQEWDSGRFDD